MDTAYCQGKGHHSLIPALCLMAATKDTRLCFQFLQHQEAQGESALDDPKQCMKTAEFAVKQQARG